MKTVGNPSSGNSSRRPVVLGLTAPFQHGKTELKPVIESAGFQFFDLNDHQNMLRVPGTVRYQFYSDLIPGCLDEQGGETVEYYRHVTPAFRARFLDAELTVVADRTEQLISRLLPGDKVVLSWELWPKILGSIFPQHMLVFMQPRERWYQRLQDRVISRGWGDWKPTQDDILRLIETMDAVPENILAAVQKMMPLTHTVIDVSPDDWGAEQLLEVLGQF